MPGRRSCVPAPRRKPPAISVRQSRIGQDLYLAGGTVEVLANVDGDIVAARGQVAVVDTVRGDVVAAANTPRYICPRYICPINAKMITITSTVPRTPLGP